VDNPSGKLKYHTPRSSLLDNISTLWLGMIAPEIILLLLRITILKCYWLKFLTNISMGKMSGFLLEIAIGKLPILARFIPNFLVVV
jgi:hypothetical protein